MRKKLSILILTLIALTACTTLSSEDYFSDEPLDDSWSTESFASYLKLFREKPLSRHDLKEGDEVYRFLVLQAGEPNHIIKVENPNNGSARVTIKYTKSGYKLNTGRELEDRKIINPSTQEFDAFVNVLAQTKFWQQENAPQYEFSNTVTTGPPLFLIEAVKQGKTVRLDGIESRFGKNMPDLALVFYDLAQLERDWTLETYFSSWKEVDWEYPDE